MKIVRIFPKTNFRDELRSDTLWGHLMVAYKVLFGESNFEKLLNSFIQNDPVFKVSSCFPFKRKLANSSNELYVDYFPKPLTGGLKDDMNSVEEMIKMKNFKKVKLVSKNIFENYLNGSYSDNDFFKEHFLQKNAEDNSAEVFTTEMKITYNLHNSIDRMSSTTLEASEGGSLYWEKEIAFGNESGIFFLFEGDENLIIPSLRYLSDIGIGGNRSIGKGSFNFSIEDYNFNVPKEANSEILLSLYNPLPDELAVIEENIINCWYDLEERSGYVGKFFETKSNQKNSVIAFKEGSTFSKLKSKGRSIKTSEVEKFSVYSYYFSFGIPAILKVQI